MVCIPSAYITNKLSFGRNFGWKHWPRSMVLN